MFEWPDWSLLKLVNIGAVLGKNKSSTFLGNLCLGDEQHIGSQQESLFWVLILAFSAIKYSIQVACDPCFSVASYLEGNFVTVLKLWGFSHCLKTNSESWSVPLA